MIKKYTCIGHIYQATVVRYIGIICCILRWKIAYCLVWFNVDIIIMSFLVVLQFTWQQQCIGPPDMCTYTESLLLLVNVVTFFFLISVQHTSTVHSTVLGFFALDFCRTVPVLPIKSSGTHNNAIVYLSICHSAYLANHQQHSCYNCTLIYVTKFHVSLN